MDKRNLKSSVYLELSVFQLPPLLEDLIPMPVSKDRFPSHFSANRAREKSPGAQNTVFSRYEGNSRDSGACCCLFVPSCIGRASSGGVHLGYFHGAVDAVRASVFDALLNSLHTNF